MTTTIPTTALALAKSAVAVPGFGGWYPNAWALRGVVLSSPVSISLGIHSVRAA
ncbi:hypothetical protein [Natronobiforma cellulositropha]|uniref:hypothetical protein n=1 Tax=Natronobiforma cellulositropha TaxID=1679076 RepID=UPI0021D613C3|nr:hypothetical protein [Natronobiforma cellulositropha]